MSRLGDWFRGLGKKPTTEQEEPAPTYVFCTALTLVSACPDCQIIHVGLEWGAPALCPNCGATNTLHKGYVWYYKCNKATKFITFEKYVPQTHLMGHLMKHNNVIIYREGDSAYFCDLPDPLAGVCLNGPIVDLNDKILAHLSKPREDNQNVQSII